MSFHKRLRKAVNDSGMSLTEFARSAGLSTANAHHIINDEGRQVKLCTIVKILGALPEVDARYLLTGGVNERLQNSPKRAMVAVVCA